MKPLRFKASFDSFVKSVTIIVCVIVLLMAPVSVLVGVKTGWIHAIPFPVICLTAIIAYGLHPVYYEVSDLILSIKCPFYTYTYPIEQIKEVIWANRDEMKYSLRVFGVGALFGFFGIFYNKKYGWMNWFATRRGNYVVIERIKGMKLVFTPDDINGFITALKQNPN